MKSSRLRIYVLIKKSALTNKIYTTQLGKHKLKNSNVKVRNYETSVEFLSPICFFVCI